MESPCKFETFKIIRSKDDLQTIKAEVQPISDDYGRLSPARPKILLYLFIGR